VLMAAGVEPRVSDAGRTAMNRCDYPLADPLSVTIRPPFQPACEFSAALIDFAGIAYVAGSIPPQRRR